MMKISQIFEMLSNVNAVHLYIYSDYIYILSDQLESDEKDLYEGARLLRCG